MNGTKVRVVKRVSVNTRRSAENAVLQTRVVELERRVQELIKIVIPMGRRILNLSRKSKKLEDRLTKT